MFRKATPESAGVPSRCILDYLRLLDSRSVSLHSFLIARGDKLICEAYWKPFDENTRHRMYSQTKSYVGLAVRLLAEDGAISLDDPIIRYFPEKLPETVHPYLQKLRIRDMLMMRTCFDEYGVNWFTSGTDDRVKLYFSQRPSVYPGTQYRYDSMGSFVLGALVEKLSKKTFLDYLRDKCLREIGFSEGAYCLKCPGGYSWSDSALLCTPRDMLAYGRFIGNFGCIDGKQIIPRHIIEDALADFSATKTGSFDSFESYGYISQFWRCYGNAICFNGMHDQRTVYDPDTDITFTCTCGNDRADDSSELLMSYAFTEIINKAAPGALPEDAAAFAELEEYIASRELLAVKGTKRSPLEELLNDKVIVPESNKAGITEFSFSFGEDFCDFDYTNAQGKKRLSFGRGKNVFQQFPQTGYSGETGGKDCEGHTYKCAASFAWQSDNQLFALVQIIDEYIGNVFMNLAVRDGHIRINLVGDAENFLGEYNAKINAQI